MFISGLSTICTPFPVLETGMVQMTGLQGTVRTVSVGSAAGLMTAIADCKGGKCVAVAFDNVSVRPRPRN